MDKISDYIGKQRKNSDGEYNIHISYYAFISGMVKDWYAFLNNICFYFSLRSS